MISWKVPGWSKATAFVAKLWSRNSATNVIKDVCVSRLACHTKMHWESCVISIKRTWTSMMSKRKQVNLDEQQKCNAQMGEKITTKWEIIEKIAPKAVYKRGHQIEITNLFHRKGEKFTSLAVTNVKLSNFKKYT